MPVPMCFTYTSSQGVLGPCTPTIIILVPGEREAARDRLTPSPWPHVHAHLPTPETTPSLPLRPLPACFAAVHGEGVLLAHKGLGQPGAPRLHLAGI